MRLGVCAALSAAVVLAACGRHETAQIPRPTAVEIDYAANAEPADKALAALYDRSCKTCHSQTTSGGPLTGQAAAWAPRIAERGADGLLASVRKGRNAMPPGGLCPDCSDDDYRGIIAFLIKEPK